MSASLSVPENTPFTAVLKFAAEEVSTGSGGVSTVEFSSQQFKVSPETSAIITNGN